jgi:hypothetical protein
MSSPFDTPYRPSGFVPQSDYDRLRESLRSAVNTRDWEIEGLRRELAEARGLLRRVVICDALTNWCEQPASDLYDSIDAFLAEKPNE